MCSTVADPSIRFILSLNKYSKYTNIYIERSICIYSGGGDSTRKRNGELFEGLRYSGEASVGGSSEEVEKRRFLSSEPPETFPSRCGFG